MGTKLKTYYAMFLAGIIGGFLRIAVYPLCPGFGGRDGFLAFLSDCMYKLLEIVVTYVVKLFKKNETPSENDSEKS